MKKVISLDPIQNTKLIIEVQAISDEDFTQKTGLKYIMRKMYKDSTLYLFKVVDHKTYCYARVKYDF